MATRNVNYFGTFLDTMKDSRSREGTVTVTFGPKGNYYAGECSESMVFVSQAPDPLNEIVKTLVDKDDLGAKDLIPLTGLSLSKFLEASHQLATLGLVDVSPAFTLRLTQQGRELAAVLRNQDSRPSR
jgi:hypothetical protein